MSPPDAARHGCAVSHMGKGAKGGPRPTSAQRAQKERQREHEAAERRYARARAAAEAAGDDVKDDGGGKGSLQVAEARVPMPSPTPRSPLVSHRLAGPSQQFSAPGHRSFCCGTEPPSSEVRTCQAQRHAASLTGCVVVRRHSARAPRSSRCHGRMVAARRTRSTGRRRTGSTGFTLRASSACAPTPHRTPLTIYAAAHPPKDSRNAPRP